ncbi:hypothetical protein EBN38_23895 [Salmonella enterica]|nr:hypothetical protein [Salmonella enterica]
MNHLKKIRDNLDDSFYMNSSTIEVFEDENIFLELKIIYLEDNYSSKYINTFPSQLFLFCVAGDIILSKYKLRKDGGIFEDGQISMEHNSVYFFGKTSDTLKCYDLIPTSEMALVLIGTSKKNIDDIYITFSKEKKSVENIISTSLSESRIEFWLTFYKELSIQDHVHEHWTLMRGAKTRKLRGFLEKNN